MPIPPSDDPAGRPMLNSENVQSLANQLSARIPSGYVVTLENLLTAIRDDATVRGIIVEWLRRVDQ